MTPLEVVGSATIYALYVVFGLAVGIPLLCISLVLLDRFRITHAQWKLRRLGWVSEESLRDWCADGVDDWWRKHKHAEAWSRTEDARDGMLLAAKQILRDQRIPVVRLKSSERKAERRKRVDAVLDAAFGVTNNTYGFDANERTVAKHRIDRLQRALADLEDYP
jgi:hypothetical protein